MTQADGKGEAKVAAGLSLFDEEFTAQSAPADNLEVVTDDGNDNSEVVTPRAPTPPASKGFMREIDLGDGSGKQVFSADTAEELLDKLTTAQENATRKIREQEFELKREKRAKPDRSAAPVLAKKELTADELFQIANELSTKPDAAIDKIFAAKTGKTATEIGNFINDFMAAQQVAQAETSFLMNHQTDYVPSAQNAARIEKFLADERLSKSAANLEYAFQELTESGLLDVAVADPNAVTVKPHTRTKPVSTGIRSNQSSATKPDSAVEAKQAASESEVEEIYKLPLEEARQKMNRLMAKAKAASGSK